MFTQFILFYSHFWGVVRIKTLPTLEAGCLFCSGQSEHRLFVLLLPEDKSANAEQVEGMVRTRAGFHMMVVVQRTACLDWPLIKLVSLLIVFWFLPRSDGWIRQKRNIKMETSKTRAIFWKGKAWDLPFLVDRISPLQLKIILYPMGNLNFPFDNDHRQFVCVCVCLQQSVIMLMIFLFEFSDQEN